jgi:hypothetical protein
LLELLAGSSNDLITVEQLQEGLATLGYLLHPSEVRGCFGGVDEG